MFLCCINVALFCTLTSFEKLSMIDAETGLACDADAPMIYRRLKVYKFRTRIPKASSRVKYCPACFAQLVLSQAQA